MKKYIVSILTVILLMNLVFFQPLAASLTQSGPIWYYDTGSYLNDAVISGDGQYVTIGTSERLFLFRRNSSIPLWNQIVPFPVREIALSSNGNYISMVTNNFDKENHNRFWLFDSNLSLIWNYTARSWIKSLSMADDGEQIVVGYYYGQLLLFNLTHIIPLINKSTSAYYMGAISEDGSCVAAGSNDGLNNFVGFYLFNTSNAKQLWVYYSYGQIGAIDLTPDAEYIVGGVTFLGNRTYLFNQTINQPMWYYEAGGEINSVGISDDGQYLVAGSDDRNLYVFHKNSSTPLWNYTAGDSVESVAISADGQFIVMGSYDCHLYFFNRSSSLPLWNYSFKTAVSKVSLDKNCDHIVVAAGNRVYLFNRNGTVPFDNYPPGTPGIPGFEFRYLINFVILLGFWIYIIKKSRRFQLHLPSF